MSRNASDWIDTTLANGLRVLLLEVPEAPAVTVWVWYRVGSKHEGPGTTGASHWVEHMLFKGTRKLQKGDIFRLVSQVGGYNNGFTSHDYTTYYETLPPDHLELGLDIESDRMANALFDPAETNSERTVIISEREGAENNPQFLLDEELRAAAFRAHPYRWSVLGWKGDLQSMTREDLYGHYQRFYAPNNAVLVVVGRFETDAARGLVDRYFAGIDRRGETPVVRTVEPPQLGERRVVVSRPGPTAYLSVVYHTPAASDPDIPALTVLDAILSGAQAISFSSGGWMGRSSRLHRSLVREKQVAASAHSSFYPSPEPNLLHFSVTVREGVPLQTAEAALLEEIDRAREELPTPAEMEKAVTQIKAQIGYGRDGVTSIAYSAGYSSLLGDREYLDRLVERVAAVTPEEVRRVARAYFTRANRSVGWFEPTPAEEAAPRPPLATSVPVSGSVAGIGGPSPCPPPLGPALPPAESPALPAAGGGKAPDAAAGVARAAWKSPQIHRETLDNGIVLLVNQRTESPTVVIRGSLKAGAFLETEEEAGLAAFTARMLMLGTESRTADEIADGIESLGASVGFGSGSEQVSLASKGIGERLDAMLSTLADCLRRPTFPEPEMERLRGEVLTEIRERDDSTRSVADRRFRQALYPEGHAYRRERLGRAETVASFTQADTRRFWERGYGPETLILALAGDVSPERARELVERHFGDWAPRGRQEPSRQQPPEAPQSVTRIAAAMNHKSQCDLVIGLPALSRTDPDFYALEFANLILGQLGLYGRLGRNVRDEKGMAYYCYSGVYSGLWGGHWAATAGVNPANVERAAEAVLEEVRRLVREPISEEELREGKGNQMGSIPLRLETADGVAGYLHDVEYYGLGLDYLEKRLRITEEMTAEQVLEAARKYLDPDHCIISVAGPEQEENGSQ